MPRCRIIANCMGNSAHANIKGDPGEFVWLSGDQLDEALQKRLVIVDDPELLQQKRTDNRPIETTMLATPETATSRRGRHRGVVDDNERD